ncbi:MAG TPA: hypothetical protein VIV66_05205, partial [Pyrinomonadaceae bacterium]
MNLMWSTLMVIVFCSVPTDGVSDRFAGCIPEGIGLAEIVSVTADKPEAATSKKVTVRETLRRI